MSKEYRKARKELRKFLSECYGCWNELSTKGQYDFVTRCMEAKGYYKLNMFY